MLLLDGFWVVGRDLTMSVWLLVLLVVVLASADDLLNEFLNDHGLTEYAGAFAEEKITYASLTLLSESDLKELGLPMGPRRVILHHAAEIKTK